MKNIWIDGYEANVLQRLGSGQVAYEILKNIALFDSKNSYTVLLPDKPIADMPQEKENFHYQILRPKKLWTKIALPLSLLTTKRKPDVFFSPTHYGPSFNLVKNVISIFDLAYYFFPQLYEKTDLYKLKNWTKASAKKAAHIITISHSAKKDIINLLGVSEDKITVAYPGFNNDYYFPVRDKQKIAAMQKKYQITKKYIIYVSTLQPKKNHKRLMQAIKGIPDLNLVIVGKTKGQGRSGWMFEDILAEPERLGIKEKVIFTGFVPDEEVNLLINGAEAFVCPSLYEGFGIPVVNAMACASPVLVSNVASLPEVVGDAGVLFNPESVEDIKEKIKMVITDEQLKSKLSALSLERSKDFSWKKMTNQIVKVLEAV